MEEIDVSIQKAINIIRKRPGMYIGSEKITPLWHFLDGCQFILMLQDSHIKDILPLNFRYFNEYICARIGICNNAGWCHNILNICNGDEKEALRRFFELYDDFNDVKINYFEWAVLSKYNIDCNNNMGKSCRMIYKTTGFWEKQPRYINPLSAYIIKLSIPAFLVAVETEDNIECDSQLYKSSEIAKETLSSAFGDISSWNTYYDTPDFKDKDIV